MSFSILGLLSSESDFAASRINDYDYLDMILSVR